MPETRERAQLELELSIEFLQVLSNHQPLDYIGGGDSVCQSARTV